MPQWVLGTSVLRDLYKGVTVSSARLGSLDRACPGRDIGRCAIMVHPWCYRGTGAGMIHSTGVVTGVMAT